LPTGCAFKDRCAHATAACDVAPAQTMAAARTWRCHHPLNMNAATAAQAPS